MAETPRTHHVAHVLATIGYGGNERLCLELIRHAPPGMRHTVLVMDPSRCDLECQFRLLANVEVVRGRSPSRGRFAFTRWMVTSLRYLEPGAVLSYTFGVPHLLIGFAARFARISRVMARAGNPPPASRERWKWRVIVELSRLLGVPIQACSHWLEEELRVLAGSLPDGSGAIPNGCDVEAILAGAERARAARSSPGPAVIGMVARLDAIKDHATLIRALAGLRARSGLPETELWLVGDGEARGALEALTAELEMTRSVRFLGARTDVAELLGRMDVFAFSTTRDEGFGIALIEGMAAGLPVVASDVPACREVLAGGEAGQLAPPGDAGAMADLLAGLLAHPTERARWRGLALARVRREYDIRGCAARWYRTLGCAG